MASEMGEKFTGRFHRGIKQFVAAQGSVPKTMQKPQSRGDATIAMNCWRDLLRSGAEPPIVTPSSNKRSPLSSFDIVQSTEKAARLGDARWTQVMSHYYAAVRRELKTLRGKEVVTTGDGLLATFGAPAAGIRCATAIREAVRTLGLEIRVGLHAGEYNVSGAEVVGLAFHIGARVAAKARAGEVLVSSEVKDLMSQSGIRFKDRGFHQLKGVPKRRRLYRVEH
jgi:class 3 adenylate cyclase